MREGCKKWCDNMGVIKAMLDGIGSNDDGNINHPCKHSTSVPQHVHTECNTATQAR